MLMQLRKHDSQECIQISANTKDNGVQEEMGESKFKAGKSFFVDVPTWLPDLAIVQRKNLVMRLWKTDRSIH